MSKDKQEDFIRKYAIIVSKELPKETSFFYGVKTTGIFCKPGCSSRLPKPQNVVFFDSTEEALRAGFRPCKKCRPLRSSTDDQTDLSVSICRIIEDSEDEPTLKDLAEKTGYSESYIQRVFKKKTGIPPKEYALQIKAERFRDGLNRGESITSSIYSAGYGSSSRVYENLEKLIAMTPSQYKNYGEGIDFRMGVFPCSLGYVLIAFTGKGVSTVQLGSDREELISEFELRFKNAGIHKLKEDDSETVQTILKKVEDPTMRVNIPLDIHGTIFQKRVWNALQQIPAGETRTYAEIAEQIGEPKSVRAVANACGKNEIAIVIPCHRVVRKDGNLAGYRWGKERKAKLLEREDKK